MRLTRFLAGLAFLTLGATAVSRAQSFPALPAVSPRDFAIMAWGLSPGDPAQLQGMKDAGLNVSGFCRVADLDLVASAGLGCFVDDSRANIYNWANMPSNADAAIHANIASLAAQVRNKPAFLGALLRDEPSVAMMAGLGKVSAALRQAIPGALPMVDLLPTYAEPGQWGVSDYQTYVRSAMDLIHPSFLSYDNYSLVNGQMLDRWYTNLEIIRWASLQANIPFWNCVLAVAHYNFMEPSDAVFNLQVYSSLAYGSRGIAYYKYFTVPGGNFRAGPINEFGDRTPAWGMLRRINLQIQALAPTLVHLHSIGVYHGPDVPPEGHSIAESRLLSRIDMSTPGIQPPIPPHYLVGEFQDNQGRPYVMLVNKSLAYSFACQLQLKQGSGKLFQVSPFTGQEVPVSGPQWLAPGAGLLLRIE